MTTFTKSDLHHALRNILLSDFGITKETIREMSEEILRERLMNDKFIDSFIKKMIMQIMTEKKVHMAYQYSSIDFDEYLRGVMSKTFAEMLKERFTLNITEN